MFRSIRWNLLAWQAVILLATVFGLGAAFFLRVRDATCEVDADLLGAAQVVATKAQQVARPSNWRFRKLIGIASARIEPTPPTSWSGATTVGYTLHPTPLPLIFGPAATFPRLEVFVPLTRINVTAGRFAK